MQNEIIQQATFATNHKITMDVLIKIPCYTCGYHEAFKEADRDGANIFYNQALNQFFALITHHDGSQEWGVSNIELTGQEFFYHAK